MNIIIVCTVPDGRAEMALSEAKDLGYRRIFCGDKADEIICNLADVCYEINWEDPHSLLEIAVREKAEGIVGLCDKAMIPVATVAQKLNLPGNTPQSLECLISKDRFRKLQDEAGVFHPNFFLAQTVKDLEDKIGFLKFPVIVKPSECSSSVGQTVVNNPGDLNTAFIKAANSSRNKKVCIEEYISQTSLRAVELDVFVKDNEILWDGLRDSYRVEQAPLRPVYDVYPANLTDEEIGKIHDCVAAILKKAGVRIGEYHIEGFFTTNGDFFVIEINPRQAGYFNPQHIQLYCGVNMTKLLLTTAVGDDSYYHELKHFKRTKRNIIAYSVFSKTEGILDHIHFEPYLIPHLIEQRYPYGRLEGCHVPGINSGSWPIAIPVFEFDTADELERVRRSIEEDVYAMICENTK